jgi:hypothetical protein
MQQGSPHSDRSEGTPRAGERTIHEWEAQYPETWILLEITEEDEGEPVRGLLITTAHNPDDLQDVWKGYRAQGVLTMLTYGCPREIQPEVIVSAT